MESKKMIEYKENLWYKIKNFFFKFFRKSNADSEIYDEELIQESNIKKNSFKKTIIIEQDEEELRLLKLQEAYKNGKILEENIPESDKCKLIDLYKKQNKKLKETIENEKYEIRKILDS